LVHDLQIATLAPQALQPCIVRHTRKVEAVVIAVKAANRLLQYSADEKVGVKETSPEAVSQTRI
jgi:hypothetical protein